MSIKGRNPPTARPLDTTPCWICDEPAMPLPGYEALPLFRCPACDLCFQPEFVGDQVRAAYDTDYFKSIDGIVPYAASVSQRRHEARVRLSFVHRFSPPPGRMLEVGSATGLFLSEAQAAGWKAVGIEPCEPVARKADEDLGTKTIAGFIEDIDLEPGTFDLVCGWHVLEHIPDPLPSLEKLRAALRPGGYAAFEVPNFRGVLSQRKGPRWPDLDPDHHVAHFSPASLQTMLASVGLESRLVTTVPRFCYIERRPGLRPRQLVRRVRYAMTTRTTTFGSHPHKFELLRIVAQATGDCYLGSTP